MRGGLRGRLKEVGQLRAESGIILLLGSVGHVDLEGLARGVDGDVGLMGGLGGGGGLVSVGLGTGLGLLGSLGRRLLLCALGGTLLDP